jgi:hypothetical protein
VFVVLDNVKSNGGHNTLLGQGGLELFFKRSTDLTDLTLNDAFASI